jgi:hypothetical protein
MAINYKVNLSKAGDELEVGKLVLVDTGTQRRSGKGMPYSTAIGKVLEYADGKGLIEVDGIGKVEAVKPRQDQTGLGMAYPDRELPLLAVNPLKTEDPVAVLHFLDGISKPAGEHPAAFHVTDILADGTIVGRLIGESSGADDTGATDQFTIVEATDEDDTLPMGLEPIGRADVTHEVGCSVDGLGDFIGAPHVEIDIRKGDILVARNCSVEIKDGKDTVRLVNVNVIGNVGNIEEAVEFLGLDAPRPGRHWQSPSLVDLGTLVHLHGMAVARTQPDKALVAFYNDPNGAKGMTLLGSSGYHAYINDELSTYLEGADLEPGLWTMHDLTNVSSHDHEGNWDAEVEGDWLPATREDIEELFGTPEALDTELAYAMEIDPEHGLGERMIKSAETALFEENFAETHREFAMRRFGIVDESHWTARQVVNPGAIDAYAAAPFADIEDNGIRELATNLFAREIRSRSSLFVSVVPTEAEREELAKEPNWGKHDPILFLPNKALDADLASFSAAVHSKAPLIARNLQNGRNLGAMNIHYLMRLLSPSKLSAAELPVFSRALVEHGAWHFVGKERKWITLALFADDVHVATLKTNMDSHTLTTAWGMNITKPHQELHGNSYWTAVREVVMAADRAVCEVEARHWRDHDVADFCAPTRDGIHKTGSGIAYIEDGVLHRTDGPALQKGPFFADEQPLMEHRFRGNLHREDGPAMYQGDFCVWYLHGLEHRIDGPSTDLGGGSVEYRQYDVLHREDGPAVEGPQSRSFHIDGRLHRVGGPAIINEGCESWYRHGLIHREDAPAITMLDGSETYCINGVLHNENGPAIVGADGEVTYALNGVEMSEADFLAMTATAPASRVPTP